MPKVSLQEKIKSTKSRLKEKLKTIENPKVDVGVKKTKKNLKRMQRKARLIKSRAEDIQKKRTKKKKKE